MQLMFLFLFAFFSNLGCNKYVDPIDWDKCSQKVGDHPCDFTLNDQNGEKWNLYNNYGTPILIDFSAEWCYWCEVAAEDINKMKSGYNFIYVTILLENRTGNPADQTSAQSWANQHNSQEPVLFGWNSEFDWEFDGLPAFFMINKEMVMTCQMDGWNLIAVNNFIKETQ
jgi:hypothetical protein